MKQEEPSVEALPAEVWDAMFPDYPPETVCVHCGRTFGDESQCHEIWKEDNCHFEPNTEEGRLGRIRQEVRHLLGLGMTVEEIEHAARQTAALLGREVQP